MDIFLIILFVTTGWFVNLMSVSGISDALEMLCGVRNKLLRNFLLILLIAIPFFSVIAGCIFVVVALIMFGILDLVEILQKD